MPPRSVSAKVIGIPAVCLPPTAATLQPASAGAEVVVLGDAVTAPASGAVALLPAAALVLASGAEGVVVGAAAVGG